MHDSTSSRIMAHGAELENYGFSSFFTLPRKEEKEREAKMDVGPKQLRAAAVEALLSISCRWDAGVGRC